MAKSKNKIVQFFKNPAIASVIVTFIIGFCIAKLNLLFIRIYIPVWLLIIIAAAPTIVIYTLRSVISLFKQKFKTGDNVTVLGDNRHFTVIEYSTWKPYHVKLLRKNGENAILVHHKFLYTANAKESGISDFTDAMYGFMPPKVAAATIRKL